MCGTGSRIALRLCGMTVWGGGSCRHAGQSKAEIRYPVERF
ncbi:hypothetical protein PJE062_4258 [Pseudovibrio sp. JE062]|nr:hypothetical protein PJE062_4258 [Pseudovibrio sp. JE062]